jgi:hypothetical protein
MELYEILARPELREDVGSHRLEEQRAGRTKLGVDYDKNGWSDRLAESVDM